MPRLAVAAVAAPMWLSAACGGKRTDVALPASVRTACDGKLGQDGRVLRSDLGEGFLFVDGSDLIHVEKAGRILRIDGCSGEATELANGIEARAAALAGEFVYVSPSGRDIALRSVLRRIPKAGGAVELLATGHDVIGLVGDDTAVYLLAWSSTAPTFTVYSLAIDSTEPRQLWARTAEGKIYYLAGVSRAGLYMREDYDCGVPCILGMLLLPFGAAELVSMAGTYGASGSVWREELYVTRMVPATTPNGTDYAGREIAKLPLVGGEGQVIVPVSEPTRNAWRMAVNDVAACWLTQDPSPRCLSLEHPEEGPRMLTNAVDAGSYPVTLVMSHTAVYWVRKAAEVGRYELVAAVP